MAIKRRAEFDIVLRDGEGSEFTIKTFTRTAFIYNNAFVYRVNCENARDIIERAVSCDPILSGPDRKMLKCIRISGNLNDQFSGIDSHMIIYSDEEFNLYFIQGLYDDFIDIVCSRVEGNKRVVSVISDIHTATEVHKMIQFTQGGIR